ncbi:MAG: hypothetical protein JWO03_2860 [Bacteroidetes bacterium]|nr:hypothetical protein [Bacteroidota bacterium]
MASSNPFDHITCYFRYGEHKVDLSPADMTYLKQIEHVKDMWFTDNDEVLTRNKVVDHYGVSERQAYAMIQDAKRIWALTENFDYWGELLLMKRQTETAIIQAKNESDGKIYNAAFRAKLDIIDRMKKYQDDNRPDEPKNTTIIFHMDYTKIGVTHEMMAEFEERYEKEIAPFVKKKFKDKDKNIESIPFEDIPES